MGRGYDCGFGGVWGDDVGDVERETSLAIRECGEFGVEEFDIIVEASRKERDDWRVTEVVSGNWGRKRGN